MTTEAKGTHTPQEARTILKAIWRNAPAFNGWGAPTSWDWPTLKASYPETARKMFELQKIAYR